MMSRISPIIALAFGGLMLAGCGQSSDHSDLREYIEETKAEPSGDVEPLPTFEPYEPFSYSAMTLRSPFDPPVTEEDRERVEGRQVEPDFNREKEYLEQFSVANLSMVGTLTKEGQLWALIDDGTGGVHAVTQGNYMGKNHGEIVELSQSRIRLMEIVADGANGWVERPRIVELEEKE